jgi:hypothetical protein
VPLALEVVEEAAAYVARLHGWFSAGSSQLSAASLH